MLKKNKDKVLLILILFLATFLRFFNLAKLPTILNRDEAALAYNSYLLLETGKDEWQLKDPFVFKSFGDYKLPGYHYLLAGFFRVFGLNDAVVRMPSAIAGIFLVLLAYFWARNIFKIKEEYSILFAFLIAVMPVFSFYSRIAFEANLALTLFVASLYFIFSEKRKLICATVLMILAVLTYNTPLLLLPFIILIIPFLDGLKNYKKWLPTVVIFSLIFILVFLELLPLTGQKSGITIFNDATVWDDYTLYRGELAGFKLKLFGSKYFYYLILMMKNLVASFSLRFLVINGGSHPWHSIPGAAHLFYISYFFSLLGLFYLIKSLFKKFNKKDFLLIYLLIVSLAPSVVTVDSPHATRSLFFFFIFTFIAVYFLNNFKRFKNKLRLKYFLIGILLFEAFSYQQKYFFDFPNQQSNSLWVEYQELVEELETNYHDKKIAVVDPGGYQYILTAWYAKMKPVVFFETMKYQKANEINFYYGEFLSNYHFIKDEADILSNEEVLVSQEKGITEGI